MELGNINEMLVIACLLAGVGIGALGYHLLNGGARSAQKLRKRLAERDRELAELRSQLSEHFERADNLLSALLASGRSLQEEIHDSAVRLDSPQPSQPDLKQADEQKDDVDAPRDYADGNRGTLSEDFGLKSGQTPPAQPPRY
ncbi:YhcB family protein [Halomonas sp. 18H]|uniref:YhcB family protein n=1 Tax=Halomonas almeriensis TaxID=308163 RepID=UPI002230785E|nr:MULTISPECIES: YhcB family protein [Halomonas]MCW4151641.1 YhcB family protein [Halomonas sp. 18H]MDN3552778.1 YhcB family protein [Halomonas almeriensis]